MHEDLFALARRVRAEAERHHVLDDHLCCMTCSVALAEVLKQRGFAARIVQGDVRTDRPVATEFGDTVAHHWVESDGLWLDITADQFNPFVSPVMDKVRVIPAGSDERYSLQGEADQGEMQEIRDQDELVHAVVAALVAQEPAERGVLKDD